jgi:TPR repeat protein
MAYDWVELSKIGRDGDTYLFLPARQHLQTAPPASPRASLNQSKPPNLTVEDIYFIGACYTLGICGKPIDVVRAMDYFKDAGDRGMVGGQYMFARLHLDDKTPFSDHETGIQYMEKAAMNGHGRAQAYCAQHYQHLKNYDKAFIYYKKCADQNNPIAQFKVGYCYAIGQGTDLDLEQSFLYIQKSANQGYLNAVNRLGVCYLYGFGTPTDPYKAIELFKSAAQQNDKHAYYNLGMLYQCGVILNNVYIVEPSRVKAIQHFKRATELGNKDASQLYDELCGYRTILIPPPIQPDMTIDFEMVD